MEESLITVRYAKALFSLAKEKGRLSDMRSDAGFITAVCSQSTEFNRFLKDPLIKSSEKIRVINLLFYGKITELSQRFLELVIRNKREVLIPSIFRDLISFIRLENNIHSVVLTTAREIDEKLLQKASGILERELGAEVELTGRVNPNIIGGIILQIDGKQYDDSVVANLKKMKKELIHLQL